MADQQWLTPQQQQEQQRQQQPAPDWYPDPAEQFTYRYWNGTAWTDHVSNGGTVSQSRLPAIKGTQNRGLVIVVIGLSVALGLAWVVGIVLVALNASPPPLTMGELEHDLPASLEGQITTTDPNFDATKVKCTSISKTRAHCIVHYIDSNGTGRLGVSVTIDSDQNGYQWRVD